MDIQKKIKNVIGNINSTSSEQAEQQEKELERYLLELEEKQRNLASDQAALERAKKEFERQKELDNLSLEADRTALKKEQEAFERHKKGANLALEQDQAELKNARESFERQRQDAQLALKEGRLALQKAQEDFECQKSQEQLVLETKLNELWKNRLELQERELSAILSQRMEQINQQERQARDEAIKRSEDLRTMLDAEHATRVQSLETELEQSRSRYAHELQRLSDEQKVSFTKRKEELDLRAAELLKRAETLEIQARDLETKNTQVNAMKSALAREKEHLEEQVKIRAADEVARLEGLQRQKDSTIENLRQECIQLHASLQHFESLSLKLGGKEPEQVLLDIRDKELRIAQLREELSQRPPEELRTRYEEMEKKESSWQEEIRRRDEKLRQTEELNSQLLDKAFELEKATTENARLRQMKEALECHNNELESALRRLQNQYGSEADRDERIKAIEAPYVIADDLPILDADDLDEVQWLEGIADKCAEYGFVFPRRILYAFHTSLKVAEWSPITVLAGVSGTGKSELPRLYSLFGGINFMMVPVQPNWDSQESMLGFFNTIDNVFDAQPVLRFLAQSQKKQSEEYPNGMKRAVNLVLLDEMNLAHMELYFAEFLSKLESRRGKSNSDLPDLDVKLGSGMKPYNIRLGRNVLWAGTMNQDETTKSLSDKVLDRSNVIYFPRPVELKGRKSIENPLPGEPEYLLPCKIWQQKWTQYNTYCFEKEEISPYKKFVEDINKALSNVGRALGHRVWQSIEYYIANYPAVIHLKKEGTTNVDMLRKAMDIAFEDQLVQKVMPKLRGIETRGKARTDCLDVIRNLLSSRQYGIVEDFSQACEMGYGQFIWNSASYLEQSGDDVGLALDEVHGD